MSRLRAVLFDAGNTLIALDYPRLAAGVSRVVEREISAVTLRAQAGEAAAALERATGTDRERGAAYLEALFLLAGVRDTELPVVRDELYRLHREAHLWGGVEPGTVEALQALRAAGFRLGVVSNSDGGVDAALEAAGLRRFFEVVVDSTLVGVEKPDPRIFTPALAALGVGPHEAVYVGDLYEIDVAGARAAGLRPVLLDPAGRQAGRDVTCIRSLGELPALLAGAGTEAVPASTPS